ncbi:MAG: KEOPS complex kinase/ATPase Bud32 [Candidatus Micrarchaeota archaeon]|nr:KEOPS complex kinase/ATPase Bud32 [Candidatus Micrarchaeota archaeon]
MKILPPKETKIAEGAEAIIYLLESNSFKFIKKLRIEKKYRVKNLDYKLRFGRTKSEAKILHKAQSGGVKVPHLLGVKDDFLLLEYLEGKTLNQLPAVSSKLLKQSAFYLANLHKLNIIHGDFTFANLFLAKSDLYVIDFGLSFISQDNEDKAVDLLTMLKSLPKNQANLFKKYYAQFYSPSIVDLAKKIQKRARYENRA